MTSPADFEVAAPHSGRRTSAAAAKSVRSSAATQRVRVYEYIRSREYYGATDDEIMAGLVLRGSSEHPRRWELVNAGLVIPHPDGRTRPTQAGRQAIVWIALGIDRRRLT